VDCEGAAEEEEDSAAMELELEEAGSAHCIPFHVCPSSGQEMGLGVFRVP
jgi:hypothetical protein